MWCTLQAFTFSPTSSSDKGQFSLRHYWRSRPSKDSMNALSVCLTGLLKSSSIPLKLASWFSLFDVNSGPLSKETVFGRLQPCAMRHRVFTNRWPHMLEATSIATLSRVNLSSIVNGCKLCPLENSAGRFAQRTIGAKHKAFLKKSNLFVWPARVADA